MNVKRIMSALLGFPLVVAILIINNKYVIDIAFSIITIIALREYFNAFKEKVKYVQWIGYLTAVLISFIHIIPIQYLMVVMLFIIPIIVMILFLQVIVTNMKIDIQSITITLFGICYIVGFLVFIPMLRAVKNGAFLVWYILIIAWGTDIFAYIVGRRIGKHKLSTISPSKTKEGAIGGIIGAVIISMLYTIIVNIYFKINLSYIYIGIISIVLSILSQIGDVAASSIKRYTNIKDFGNLIPGHGGILDRIDSVIFIAPITYFLLVII